MANIKSQIKRNRQNDKRRLRNRVYRGQARTAVKDARVVIESQDAEASKKALLEAISALDKAAEKGVGEREAAPMATAHAAGRPPGDWLLHGFQLTGADLFRLNCRSCHGPEGKGGRPGIPPLWGAVEKAPIAAGEEGGEIRVRHRLVEGGRVMPNFVHLEPDETNLLIGHLRTLGKPGAVIFQRV